jgi:hypothetical protein
MNPKRIRRLLYLALFVLYLLHNDLWLWNDASLVMGIPIGLFYHIMFAIAASIMMILLVRYAWPAHLEVSEKGGAES